MLLWRVVLRIGQVSQRMLPLCVVMWALVSLVVACGRTSILVVAPEDTVAGLERCNGRDDDGDLRVDETFRDELGRYVADEHCGSCDHRCYDAIPHAADQGCALIAQAPVCVARACEAGYGVSRNGRCVSIAERLCMPCESASDCGPLLSASCDSPAAGSPVAEVKHCSIGCEQGCPRGYACQAGRCLPEHGDCACDGSDITANYERGCLVNVPDGSRCAGRQRCDRGVLSECRPDPERCDGEDNDCDGETDEGYRDALGAYSLDEANCGACGVDCSVDAREGRSLRCGGDPFAPSCVLACSDRPNVAVGDTVDADRSVENGCECRVRSLEDQVDPTPGGSASIDENCDGADGEVRSSYYVAADGDDSGPGSVTRPFRSIAHAVTLAAGSLAGANPRPHVYVASGTYTEIVEVPGGVQIHGGYRHDFLARNPEGFDVLLLAPPESTSVAGAALVIDAASGGRTVVEGLRVRGFDADDASQPALGIWVRGSSSELLLRDLFVHSGQPAAGSAGPNGAAGAADGRAAADGGGGDLPLGAAEDRRHLCGPSGNLRRGGAPGLNGCGGREVSGGAGGSANCPSFGQLAANGAIGMGAGGGSAGLGGTDVTAPIMGGPSCTGVCCGLADFTVPTSYQQATPGGDGAAGSDGTSGRACSDPLGHFSAERWLGGAAAGGTAGAAGSGGGGGGAGGGVEFNWVEGQCEFADGLGGAGGGGGAGGCGGAGGNPGESAAPAVGVLINLASAAAAPRLERVVIETESAADGGDGGAGGDGAFGGRGGSGGSLPREALATPTLAGAAAGERGGNGGHGGAGGAGGGGCGGSSIGIWVTGTAEDATLVSALRGGSRFSLGTPGRAGRGGGGAVPAADGMAGRALDVLIR